MSEPELFQVVISRGAQADLDAIAAYLAEHADAAIAVRFVDALLERIEALETFPLRGAEPKELVGANRRGYRQLVQGNHRISYRVTGNRVELALVADGRRDMRTLLAARLLAP